MHLILSQSDNNSWKRTVYYKLEILTYDSVVLSIAFIIFNER